MARPRTKIDPEQLKRLAACGCTLDEMASVLGCHRRTLERRFAGAIEEGRLRGRSSIRHRQFQRAMSGDKTMLVWLGKQLLGQRDRIETIGLTPEGAQEFVKDLGVLIHESFAALADRNAEVAAALADFKARLIRAAEGARNPESTTRQ